MTEAEELELLTLRARAARARARAGGPIQNNSEPGGGPPPARPVPEEEKPGLVETVFHQGLGGFFKQGSDEAIGAITRAKVTPDAGGSARWRDASAPSGFRTIKTGEDAYLAGRDTERAKLAKMQQARPLASTLANIGGDIASDAALAVFGVPVLSAPYQAAVGALSGLMGSDSEVATSKATPESRNDAAISTGITGVASALIPKAGRLVGGRLKNTLSKFAGGKAAAAVADAAMAETKKAETALRSALGALGGETSSGNRTLTVLREVLADPNADAAQKTAAKEFLESEAGRALVAGVRENTLDRAGRELSRIETAKAAVEPARAATSPQAVAAATREALASPLKKQVLPRATLLANRFLPTALTAATYAVTDDPYVAGGIGGITALVQGRPGTVIRNLGRNPAVRKAVWEGVEGASNMAGPAIQAASQLAPFGVRQLMRLVGEKETPEQKRARLLIEALRRSRD